MKFNVEHLKSDLISGLEQLASSYDLIFTDDGYKVSATLSSNKQLQVDWQGASINISYPTTSAFFRGIGHVIQAYQAQQTSLSLLEEVQFDMNALMFDCSRNAVLNMRYLKQLLQKMALIGQNTFMLYMEDTFEIKEQPYFGYRRGRYSHEELKEIDAYALTLGIEVIPCIQTLAHVNQFLRWSAASKYHDIDDVLLVGSPEVRQLIDQMFSNLSACFTSNRIHVGMDEAYNLGRGKYLDQFGLHTKVEIMQQHLKDVQDIAATYQKEMMIWDDMFFRGDDLNNVKLENLQLMYWDYYSGDEQHYEKKINERRQLTEQVMFAGGAWRWMGYVPHHQATLLSNQASLTVCKRLNVKDVMVTCWGDDGSESIADSCLFGAVLYGEHGYNQTLDMAAFNEKLSFITGVDLQTHLLIDQINRPDANPNHLVSGFSKYVLYQDPLFSLCETSYAAYDLQTHFSRLKQALLDSPSKHSSLELYLSLVEVLSLKWNLGLNLRSAYANQDKEALMTVIHTQIEPLIVQLESFKELYRLEWLTCYKSYGYEIIDLRLSGLIGRLKTTKLDVLGYIVGATTVIEPLEEEILPFYEGQEGLMWLNQYGLIVSGNRLTW